MEASTQREGVKDGALRVPLTWEDTGDLGLRSALQGHRRVWDKAPESTAIWEIQSQGSGWAGAQLVRVWRGPEEVTLQINFEGWNVF